MDRRTEPSSASQAPWSAAAAAERLRQLLDERRLSIARLARELDISRQTVHRWLQGQHISPANLERLAGYFEVSLLWLQTGDDFTQQNLQGLGLPDFHHSHLSPIFDYEHRLNLGSRVARMAIWEYNLNNSRITWSGDTETVFGINIDHEEASHLLMRYHPHDQQRLQQALRQTGQSGIPLEGLEARLQWPDGSEHWVELWGDLHTNTTRRQTSVVGSVRDITQRKHLQQHIEQSNRILTTLREQLPYPQWLVRSDGQWQPCNRAARQQTLPLDTGLKAALAQARSDGNGQCRTAVGDCHCHQLPEPRDTVWVWLLPPGNSPPFPESS